MFEVIGGLVKVFESLACESAYMLRKFIFYTIVHTSSLGYGK